MYIIYGRHRVLCDRLLYLLIFPISILLYSRITILYIFFLSWFLAMYIRLYRVSGWLRKIICVSINIQLLIWIYVQILNIGVHFNYSIAVMILKLYKVAFRPRNLKSVQMNQRFHRCIGKHLKAAELYPRIHSTIIILQSIKSNTHLLWVD